jgi:hypothetical protein
MVMWWTSPQYAKKHQEGKEKRALMQGTSHVQGSKNLALALQEEVSKWFLHYLISRYC